MTAHPLEARAAWAQGKKDRKRNVGSGDLGSFFVHKLHDNVYTRLEEILHRQLSSLSAQKNGPSARERRRGNKFLRRQKKETADRRLFFFFPLFWGARNRTPIICIPFDGRFQTSPRRI